VGDRSQRGPYAMLGKVGALRPRGDMFWQRIAEHRRAQQIPRTERADAKIRDRGAGGGGLMYFYLYEYASWEGWASGRLNTVGSQYRGDVEKRRLTRRFASALFTSLRWSRGRLQPNTASRVESAPANALSTAAGTPRPPLAFCLGSERTRRMRFVTIVGLCCSDPESPQRQRRGLRRHR